MAKKKGTINETDPAEGRIIIKEVSNFKDYVSYEPGNWSQGELVDFTPTTQIDPITRLPIGSDVEPTS